MNADAAGVLFTANPVTRSFEETIVTANTGLGESVVADVVTPDTFHLRKRGGVFKVVHETISTKLQRVVLTRAKRSTGAGRGDDGSFDSSTRVVSVVGIASKEEDDACI